MPELPEVESTREYLEATVLAQPIKEVRVMDERILCRTTSAQLGRCLAGKVSRSVYRYGKRLFLELEEDLWLTIHLGMTGKLIYLDMDEAEPAHIRLLIRFKNGCRLAFDDLRIFGEAGLTESPAAFLAEGKTGADALLVERDEFLRIMHGRKGNIKSLLLNQRLISGIGNLYADEALFQAGIRTRYRDLDEVQTSSPLLNYPAGSEDLDLRPGGFRPPARFLSPPATAILAVAAPETEHFSITRSLGGGRATIAPSIRG